MGKVVGGVSYSEANSEHTNPYIQTLSLCYRFMVTANYQGFCQLCHIVVRPRLSRAAEPVIYIQGERGGSVRVSDSGARGRGFETYRRRVVSLSKTLYSPKVLVNYPGSGGSVPT